MAWQLTNWKVKNDIKNVFSNHILDIFIVLNWKDRDQNHIRNNEVFLPCVLKFKFYKTF